MGATAQVKGVGKFVVPGLCMIKTRLKPATKAGQKEVFGKVVMVKAKPARTVVKAFPAAALKNAILRSTSMLPLATSDLDIRHVGVPRDGLVRQPVLQGKPHKALRPGTLGMPPDHGAVIQTCLYRK